LADDPDTRKVVVGKVRRLLLEVIHVELLILSHRPLTRSRELNVLR